MAETAAETHDHDHDHDHGSPDEQRGHQLSMQCWRLGQRARTPDDWRKAIEAGQEAVDLLPQAAEPRFNLAMALAGLASSGDVDARLRATQEFDAGRGLAPEAGLIRYATEAAALLEKRPELQREPAVQYALGTHLAALGKIVRARRALEAAAAEPTLADIAGKALRETPEPQVVKASPVGRNDPCPCGSGKKYKRCHGA